MSQNDFSIANQTSSALRLDLNNALQALASLSSGSIAPTTTYANMLWYDTGTNLLKMRTEADDGWVTVAYLDQGSGAFRILDDTQVVNTSGTQTGLIGDQATSTWEGGIGTAESLVSPAKVKAAIEALAPSLVTQTAGTAPYYAARAWCIATGGLTPVLQASANIASVTSPNLGVYQVTFTVNMPDANYVVLGSAEDDMYPVICHVSSGTRTVSGFTLNVRRVDAATSTYSPDFLSFSVFR